MGGSGNWLRPHHLTTSPQCGKVFHMTTNGNRTSKILAVIGGLFILILASCGGSGNSAVSADDVTSAEASELVSEWREDGNMDNFDKLQMSMMSVADYPSVVGCKSIEDDARAARADFDSFPIQEVKDLAIAALDEYVIGAEECQEGIEDLDADLIISSGEHTEAGTELLSEATAILEDLIG